MKVRTYAGTRAIRCPGSNQIPRNPQLNVGNCPRCGVRTFLNSQGMIQEHIR